MAGRVVFAGMKIAETFEFVDASGAAVSMATAAITAGVKLESGAEISASEINILSPDNKVEVVFSADVVSEVNSDDGSHRIDIEAVVSGYTEAQIGVRHIHMIDSAT